MGRIDCVCCQKLQRDFEARTFAIIPLVNPFCTEFHAVTKRYQMHPYTMKRSKTWIYGPMGCIECVCCEKFQRDFVAWTFVLIALVRPILHRVSCSYETIPNAPKHYETQQKKNLGSNGKDWLRLLPKITTWLCVTNLYINCTSSPSFAPSFMQLWNDPKCTQGLYNTQKHECWIRWGWIECVRCNKFWHDFVARFSALIRPVQYVLHHVSCSYEIIQNELKHYATHKNMKLGSNGMDQVHLLRKIKTWLRGTNFCINCTSSPRFAPSFMQLRNDPKCTQTLWNTQKHKFRVQRDGSVC